MSSRPWMIAWLGGPVIGIANGVTRELVYKEAVGAFWLVLTVLFEFGFGRGVDGKSWSDLLADYNLAEGRLWPLVLAWLALGPFALRRAEVAVRRAERERVG